MAKNLRTFMRDAIAHFPGSIKVVDVPVDRRFGITAYAAKLAQNGEYKGILFNNVIGSRFPVVTNLMSSYDRMAMAMNCQIEDLPQVYGTRVNKPIAPEQNVRMEASMSRMLSTLQGVSIWCLSTKAAVIRRSTTLLATPSLK